MREESWRQTCAALDGSGRVGNHGGRSTIGRCPCQARPGCCAQRNTADMAGARAVGKETRQDLQPLPPPECKQTHTYMSWTNEEKEELPRLLALWS